MKIARRFTYPGHFMLSCLTLVWALASVAAPERAVLDRAVQRVFPALVRITVVMQEADQGRLEKHVGAGSGAIISKDGYIITNHHVAGKGRRLFCRMPDGEEIEATLVGTDALADIAIIKLDLSQRKSQTPLVVATFGDSDGVRLGDTVLAMGSPMAVSQSVTKGIVSNLQLMMPDLFWFSQFKLDGENTGSLVRWIGHDAVIFGGNSGGPLVNLEGEIIGINEVGLGSLGGAIPSNLAKSVAEQLIKQGAVDRSWIGLEAQPLLRACKEEKGVLVSGVIAGSPAAVAGLRAGDIVTAFDGEKVTARTQEELPVFNALVMAAPIGKHLKIKALRDGQEQSFTLVTRARGKARAEDAEFKSWGITVSDYTMLAAIERNRPNTDGVLVTSVNPAGPAGSAKPELQRDDTIVSVAGKPVRTVADLRAITEELMQGSSATGVVAVEFERGVSRMVTAARPNLTEAPSEANARKPGLSMLLQPISPDLAKVLGLKEEGARVAFVFPGGAAEKAGIRVGDILTQFDGESVSCRQESELKHFLAKVRHHQPGDEVACVVQQEGKAVTVKFALEADDPAFEDIASFKDKELEFTLRELTPKERIQQRIPAEVQGVRMEEVKASGWASLAHVAVGDLLLSIDGTPTPDVATARRLLAAASEKKPRRLVFHLRRGVHTLFAELEPTWDSTLSTKESTTRNP